VLPSIRAKTPSSSASLIRSIRAPNPIYHQVAFGSLQLLSVSRIIYLIKYRLPPSSEHPAKKVIGDMIIRGVALFGIAFIIWNLDNLFCDTWRSLRVQVAPFGFMLEGHGQS
jgi:dihydroceramidase